MAERWHGEDAVIAAATGALVPILALEGIAAVGFTTSGVAAGQSNPPYALITSF
jgi:hypothetical protein